jgi:hypothetical protein
VAVASVATIDPLSSSTPRLRPGERPAWWDARADQTQFEAWRAAARDASLSVDVWIALLLEFDLVLSDLQGLDDPVGLLERATHGGGLHRLGSWTELRKWLEGTAVATTGVDELPELLVPERIAARLTPGLELAGRLRPRYFELARACDRCAALQGRTMESWALQTALQQAEIR